VYDIVIIGGGPVGSYLAGRLAEAGDKVLTLERKGELEEQVCCTGIVSWECVNSFAIDNNVILKWTDSATIFSPSGRLLRLQQEKTQACILNRAAFNLAMARQAQSKGVEYVLNCLVRDVQISHNGVSIKATWQKEKLNFKARAAVIATGFDSNFGERLGLGKVRDFALGAQAEVETNSLAGIEVYLGRKVAPGFFAWLVPLQPKRALVGLLSRHSPELYLRKLISSLLTQQKITSVMEKISYRGVSLKPPARTYGLRLLIVGDAAGQVKPVTGGGIYYGLLSADIAANILHQALKTNDLSAKNLANYEREWKQKLGRELQIAYYARKLYEHLGDKQIDGLFDMMSSNGIVEALLKAEDLSFDWHAKAILRALKLTGRRILSKPFRRRGFLK